MNIKLDTKLGLIALAAVATLSGCATNGFAGSLYSDVYGPITATANAGSCPKMGEASATSILGLVSSGDASIISAKRNGGIKKVHSVDFHNKSILGIVATTTVKVCGE